MHLLRRTSRSDDAMQSMQSSAGQGPRPTVRMLSHPSRPGIIHSAAPSTVAPGLRLADRGDGLGPSTSAVSVLSSSSLDQDGSACRSAGNPRPEAPSSRSPS